MSVSSAYRVVTAELLTHVFPPEIGRKPCLVDALRLSTLRGVRLFAPTEGRWERENKPSMAAGRRGVSDTFLKRLNVFFDQVL